MKSSLARNSAWVFGGQGLSFVIQGLYFVVLARLLGSSEYGVLAGAIALISIVSQYSTLGSGLLFLRYVSPDHERFGEYWGNVLLSALTAGVGLVCLLCVGAHWFLRSTPLPVVMLLAVSDCLCVQLIVCAGQVFQAFERMRITATLALSSSAVRLLLALAMLVTVHRASAGQWAIASLMVSFAAMAAALYTVTVRFGRPVFRMGLLRSRLSEGLVFALSGSTTSAYNDLDKAMLAHYGMSTANGLYTVAYRLVDICSTPIRSIHAAAFPRFFKCGAGGVTETEPFARKLLKRTSVFGLLAAAAMFIGAPLVPLVIGHGFAQSVSALRWLSLIPFFRAFHLSAGDALAGAGLQRFRTGTQLVTALLNFGLNLYLIPHYSWLGAAWSSLLCDGGLGLASWAVLLALKNRECAVKILPISPVLSTSVS